MRRAILAFAANDTRMVRRDPVLAMLALTPVLLLAAVRIAWPVVTSRLVEVTGIDPVAYQPLALTLLFVIHVPFMIGALVGLLVLDERDEGVLPALRVTPLSLSGYGAYRASAATVASVCGLIICVAASGLLAGGRLSAAVPSLVLAGALAPLLAVGIPALAANKVEGLAVLKASGLLLYSPLGAWFLEPGWELLLGVVPTYWPVKAFWLATEGRAAWTYLAVGAAYHAGLLWWLVRRFSARVG